MLGAMTKLEQQNAILADIRDLWNAGEDLEELPKSLGFTLYLQFLHSRI